MTGPSPEPVVHEAYVLPSAAATADYAFVREVANSLLDRLNEPQTLAAIHRANQPGTSSAEVQAAFAPAARALGFSSEKTGLFEGSIPGLRPDYFQRVGETGIILEVERGKTTTNNMDLLDFWKCHLCSHAHYLFLLVPRELRHNPTMSPKREFASVQRRLSQFFVDGNYTNVWALHLYGY